MHRTLKSAMSSLLVCGCVILTGAGCAHETRSVTDTEAMKVTIQPSTRRAYTGESVTFFSKTENTLGRKAAIHWRTTGGKLTTEEAGRVARVIFEKPGTYGVDAVLKVDGKEVKRDTVVVEITAMP